MKVSLELAANYFETTEKKLYSTLKYSKYVSKSMFDMDRYIADQKQTQDLEDYVFLEEDETPKPYIPFQDREPLEASYIMQAYWSEQKTTLEMANELNVPEAWVQKEIKRLELGKVARGIRFKSGHKGKVMSKEQRKKRQNQPHAKPIVQICPKTYLTIKEYNSQGAVERDGFSRENVRRAVKTGGLSKGYLWAFKDLKEATIRVAKKNESLIKRKLQAREYKKPTKNQLEKLYIIQKKTLAECADIFNCHPTTLAILAGRYGLRKRTGKVSETQLKHLYINQGQRVKQIAEELGYAASSISTYLSRLGIKRETA